MKDTKYLKDSQDNLLCIGDKLASSERGIPYLQLIRIEGEKGIFKKLFELGEEIVINRQSLKNSKWVVCKTV